MVLKIMSGTVGVLLVKRLSEHAILPVRASASAAGYDLCRCVCVRARGERGVFQVWFRFDARAAAAAAAAPRAPRARSAEDVSVPARGRAVKAGRCQFPSGWA